MIAANDSTVFALTTRRWLAAYFDVPPESRALIAARRTAFEADSHGYVRNLMADQHITAVIGDDGYPQPTVTRDEFEQNLGVPVYRAARIEPWIAELQKEELPYVDFEAAFERRLDEAAADPLTVAYKSVIGYRTGLDVTNPTSTEAAAAYDSWMAAGWPKDRGPGKIVRDYLLQITLRAARRHERLTHIHCGGGDPENVFTHASPKNIYPLLQDHMDQPIVLIHSGWPWLAEGAYIASIMPFVYLDISEFLPWASVAIDRELELLVGVAPSGKILYGSDGVDPEVLWVSARMTREALERVLTRAVERDYLTLAEARRVGVGIMAENSRRLHGIS
jgi:predicted TIM-barrel fold metal-dependent hydrolase